MVDVTVRQLVSDTGYVMGGFPLAIASFVVMITGLSAGFGLLVVVVGVLVLAATMLAGRLFADIERLRIAAVLNRPRSRPNYRTSEAGDGIWRRITTPIIQTQSLARRRARHPDLPARGGHLRHRADTGGRPRSAAP